MNKNRFLLAAISVVFVACGTTEKSTQVAKDMASAQEVRDKAEQARLERKQALLEREVKTVPDWVVSPPHADHTGIYGVGIGSDVDLTNSMRKARLQSMYELAKAFRAEVSGEDTMIGSGDNEYRYVVDLFVNKVSLAGTEVIKQEVVPVGGVYKTYALLKYPLADFNNVIAAEKNAARRTDLQTAYTRLMARVEREEAKAIERSRDQAPAPASATALPPRAAADE